MFPKELNDPNLRRVIWSSLIGATIEWYDFFLYGTAAALVFNRLFFPTFDPLTGTLAAFGWSVYAMLTGTAGEIGFRHTFEFRLVRHDGTAWQDGPLTRAGRLASEHRNPRLCVPRSHPQPGQDQLILADQVPVPGVLAGTGQVQPVQAGEAVQDADPSLDEPGVGFAHVPGDVWLAHGPDLFQSLYDEGPYQGG